MSERSDVKFQGGAPTRCPYCHDAVDRTSDAWVACEACLARHHAACWTDAGACGACHETACVVPSGVALEPSIARPASARTAALKGDDPLEADVAVHELAVQGEPPVWLAAEPSLVVFARARDSVEALAVRVRNGTERPQQIDVVSLPPWVSVEGSGVTAAPGETVTLRLRARVADAALSQNEPAEDERRTHPAANGVGAHHTGTLHIRCGEVARLVPIDVFRPFSDLALRVTAAVLCCLLLGPVIYFHTRSKAKPVTRSPAETQASWLLRQRVAAESAHQLTVMGPIVLGWVALVIVACLLLIAS